MNGLLIFNKINDVVYYKFNDLLHRHLIRIGVKSGMNDSDLMVGNTNYRNLIVQIFSPLVTSQRFMFSQFDNSYSSVETEDGLVTVFATRWSYTFLAMNDRRDVSLSNGHKRIAVFIEFVKMICGTTLNILSHPDGASTLLLHDIMREWDLLYKCELSYLVEGVERLIINPNLRSTCVKLMENVLTKMRTISTEETFCHSMLLVNNKLVALFSSRNAGELYKGDLLLLIALTKALHSNDRYHLNEIESTLDGDFNAVVLPSTDLLNSDCHLSRGIFLRTKLSGGGYGLTPHVCHSVNINRQMKIVILAEIPNYMQISCHLTNSFEILHNLLANGNEDFRCSKTKINLDQSFARIQDSIKKLKLETDQERMVKNLSVKWENLKKNGFASYLQNGSKLILTPKLEITATALCDNLQSVFQILVLPSINKSLTVECSSALLNVESLVIERLGDYVDYLIVKSDQNVTMSSYLQTYPGLIYFIYIDRNTSFLIAPSVAECDQQRREYLATVNREKVWEMAEFALTHLQKQCLSLMWQDQNYYCSYFLWFEDASGKPLKIKKLPSFKNYPFPGIICGDFYRKLISDCFPLELDKIQCYELFQIHVGVTTPPVILEHAKQLSASIWEISGVAQAPLDLL